MFFKRQPVERPESDAVSQAVATFRQGINCTQALVSTYGPRYGLDRTCALKIGGAFGSGMNMGETCGAVTGALMIIGLRHAKVGGSRFLSRERTAGLTQEFLRRFRARNGATACKDLLGCDLGTPEGRRAAKQESHFKKQCPKFVQDAAEILEELGGD